ncbi:MAG: PAS domain S-box protein [bacterium]|nr:PAS domain S-box protein [bacterium]
MNLKKESNSENYDILFNNIFNSIIITDNTGKIVDINDGSIKMFEMSPNSFKGKVITELFKIFHDDKETDLNLLFSIVLKKGKFTGALEFSGDSTPGLKTEVRVLPSRNFEKNGLYYWISRNISSRLKIEKTYRENEQIYFNIVEKGSDGIVIIQDYRLVFVNKRLCEITGYTKEELLNMNFLNFVSSESKEYITAFYKARLKGESVSGRYSLKLMSKSGVTIPTEVNASIIEYHGKTADLAIIRDDTERYKAEEIKSVLYQIAQSANLTDNLEELLHFTQIQLSAIIDTTNFFVGLYDESSETYSFPIFIDKKHKSPEFSKDEMKFSLTDYVRRKGIPVLWKKGVVLPDFTDTKIVGSQAKCWLGVPLRTSKGIIGVIVVQSYISEKAYDEDHLDLLSFVSGHIAQAIERKKTDDALRESEIKHRYLLNSIKFPVIALDQNMKLLYFNKAYEEFTGMSFNELNGSNVNDLNPKFKFSKTYEAYTKVMETGEPEEIMGEFRGNIWQIWIYKIPEGIISVSNNITKLKNTEETLNKSLSQLKTLSYQVIDAMSLTVETRDLYTAGHQKRVAQLAVEIAKKMGLTEEQIQGLNMAAIIHDIGKIYVPAEILSKPSFLTEIEYNIIKAHPSVSYDILKTIDFPWEVAKIVLQHHERIDGSGYPDSLKGTDIMLEAKILAVADVVEAMTFHRPYRKALGITKALDEIKKNRGKLYDPTVVDACLEIFRDETFAFK